MLTERQITKIVKDIIWDLSDRRGLKGEWNAIDDDIKREIRREWRRIVREVANGTPESHG